MKVKLYLFVLFLVIGCVDKQNHRTIIGGSDSITGNFAADNGKRNAATPIMAHTADERLELGASVCYLNKRGDTIIPLGKYRFGISDTINHIGFLLKNWKWITVDNEGNELFRPFIIDNGPDYVQEGLFRIVDDKGLIGFADTLGNVRIIPQFFFAFPFKDSKAKVTYKGESKEVQGSGGEIYYWASDDWLYITPKGKIVPLSFLPKDISEPQ